uniref:G-protein coupled receptor Mth-like 5 n=1 Tax=Timema monikensis TaxID=170555 RepID=A0A7R9HPI8_9NEOP|nr:unnamed protein product [Timema monikensis]
MVCGAGQAVERVGGAASASVEERYKGLLNSEEQHIYYLENMVCGAGQAVERVGGAASASAEERYKGRLNSEEQHIYYLENMVCGAGQAVERVGGAASASAEERYKGRLNSEEQHIYYLEKGLKCCESFELMIDRRCLHQNDSDIEPWTPMFTSETGHDNVQVPAFKFVIGIPECGSRQQWPIYHYPGSQDRLSLLPSGRLRHYISHHENDDVGGTLPVEGKEKHRRYYYEYELGTYCLDKVCSHMCNQTKVVQDKKMEAQYAVVCAPAVATNWNNTDYLIRRLVDPVLHDTVKYVSLLAAFFWLNSMGYYIWKTFRSRNVFLRVTDGRKYCYYSLYAWGSTLTMTLVALFAHFFLDTGNPMSQPSSIKQDNVGWLGIAMFFTPVGFTILVNIFFYLTTGQIINRMSTYGRIHHKMKYNFDMFVKLFLVMSLSWLFLLLSWLKFDALVYCHIGANALQAPLILYICVLGQKRVRILLRKTCCYEGCPCTCCRPGPPQEGMDWGEEMMTMNTAHY